MFTPSKPIIPLSRAKRIANEPRQRGEGGGRCNKAAPGSYHFAIIRPHSSTNTRQRNPYLSSFVFKEHVEKRIQKVELQPAKALRSWYPVSVQSVRPSVRVRSKDTGIDSDGRLIVESCLMPSESFLSFRITPIIFMLLLFSCHPHVAKNAPPTKQWLAVKRMMVRPAKVKLGPMARVANGETSGW